jgi:mRNA interferase MazF
MRSVEPLQWRVVRSNLDPVRGSEQSGERPVLIVSRETFNEVLSVIHVLSLTTRRPGRKLRHGEVLLPAGVAGQPNESIVLAYQGRTISKDRIVRSYGSLTDEDLRARVRDALKVYLDL